MSRLRLREKRSELSIRIKASPRNRIIPCQRFANAVRDKNIFAKPIQKMMINAKLTSSTNNSRTSLTTVLINPIRNSYRGSSADIKLFLSLQIRTVSKRNDEVAGNQVENRPVSEGPVKSDSFAHPERTEGGQQDTYDKLQSILWNTGEWTMKCKAKKSHNHKSSKGL
jgi:hypothetical protein